MGRHKKWLYEHGYVVQKGKRLYKAYHTNSVIKMSFVAPTLKLLHHFIEDFESYKNKNKINNCIIYETT